ncbi:tyrosine-type recombinase/integrase [Sphingomonas arantia]|uniref:Tyrosine-type recombinase/integrase n=1 Tax=Sphingomonas arantia TaxID=1460676 RepID=A0ABW4U059_9SPHN
MKAISVMARTVKDAKLDTRAARDRLPVKAEPYWKMLNEGEHLGYYRGVRVAKWVARYRKPRAAGGYAKTTLAEADDDSDADGSKIMDYRQAQAAARAWFELVARGGPKQGPFTVGDALTEYLAKFRGKSIVSTRSRVETVVRPDWDTVEVAQLTQKQVADWHRARAASPAKLRTGKFALKQNERETVTEDAIRRRRSTANRDLTVLKAALNRAADERTGLPTEAWRNVKPFANVDAAKLRYLSDEEVRLVVNAVDPVIRKLVQAALLTGARYGELTAAKVRDFDQQANALWLLDTKAGKPRIVYLEAEGVRLFKQLAHGREAGDLLLPRGDGKRWGHSQQTRYMKAACVAAKIEPAGFHDLRRTYGARLALRGVPMAVIAEALGHADERITRKHYAHLSPSYVSDTVRQHAAGLGIVAEDDAKVVPIAATRPSKAA